MITKDDLQAAIAECQGKPHPDAKTCIMLAAFYTIQSHLFPETPERMGYGTQESYSYSPGPVVSIDSNSEFARTVNGRNPSDVWPVMNELMETLQVLQPRLYNAVMEKL